jgi:hypothetical protein
MGPEIRTGVKRWLTTSFLFLTTKSWSDRHDRDVGSTLAALARTPPGRILISMSRRRRTPKGTHDSLACSFCGKSKDEVDKLIAGPSVYICDACVRLCNEILDKEGTPSR